MALFGSKKTKTEVVEKAAAPAVKKATKKVSEKKSTAVAPVVAHVAPMSAASIILRPHITEKSGILSQGGVYTFVVTKGANKPSIAQAIKALYKVSPIKVTVVNLPSKNVFVRGKKGVVSGIRKAVVTLKEGDKIDFV
ncbi:MAG TPA: 50S ribosomal protein L23 [Candidatus Paceibacterota bacterium]|jgi:large subunit ribosomal protein L23|nr:50S ribosomal protein L23 [Candidatus Paceibacterota bacterium]